MMTFNFETESEYTNYDHNRKKEKPTMKAYFKTFQIV